MEKRVLPLLLGEEAVLWRLLSGDDAMVHSYRISVTDFIWMGEGWEMGYGLKSYFALF